MINLFCLIKDSQLVTFKKVYTAEITPRGSYRIMCDDGDDRTVRVDAVSKEPYAFLILPMEYNEKDIFIACIKHGVAL